MEQRTLTLSYVPEVDDLVEVLAAAPGRRRARNRSVRNAVTVLLLLCLIVWAGTLYPTSDTPLAALFFVACFGSYSLRAFTLSSRWGLRRRAGAIWQRSPKLRETHEEEIGPLALTLRTEGLTHIYAWSQFSGFLEFDRQFVLVDRSGKPSVVVPKRGLSDPSLVPLCRRLLAERLTTPSPPGAVAAPGEPPA